MKSGTAPPPAAASLPNARKYLIFGVMAFGQFMALIDIQIVAASLNDIQAGLSAGPDEISWVQTAYLMAELVMIPFSGFLAQALSTRGLFALSAGLFTLSSALCGLAWDIQSMILFRAIQGFVGGAMVPTVFATGFSMFSGPQRAMIPAILGMVSTLAPTLGPTVGGWITDTIDWRWIFYINIVPGACVTVLAWIFARVDTANPSLLKRIDWIHLGAMATFLAGLEYVLEEGPRYDWFDDPDISVAGWLSLVGFLLFLERSFYSKSPIVKLPPFRKPTFAFACLFNLVIGFGMYAATYLVPVFLGRVRGYSSFDIGTTVFVSGIAMALGAPIAATFSQKADPRLMITCGLILFAAGLWLFSDINSEWGYGALFWPQIVRGFAIMLCIVPSVTMALSGFALTELRYASGLFNLMRNLGGAIGIAVVNTWLQDQTRIHALHLGEAMGESARMAQSFIGGLAQQMTRMTPDPAHAMAMAQGEMGRMVGRQALTLAFDDVFRLMAWLFVAALLMVPFCRPPSQAQASAPVEAH
ncbi:MAG TPA: DHA2 family efflux MFS transporter permease subunit [Aliidongia sp.]|nr:DHA2 family efflux MFS transporter permease subunit [Aliidongia sp.]